MNSNNFFKCAYCHEKKNEYGNRSSFVSGTICEECNKNVELPKRLIRDSKQRIKKLTPKEKSLTLAEIQLMIKYGDRKKSFRGWQILGEFAGSTL